jgi:hypothetical protein
VHPNPSPLVRTVLAGSVLALLFACSFLGAPHSPAPHGLPVGLAGPPARRRSAGSFPAPAAARPARVPA